MRSTEYPAPSTKMLIGVFLAAIIAVGVYSTWLTLQGQVQEGFALVLKLVRLAPLFLATLAADWCVNAIVLVKARARENE